MQLTYFKRQSLGVGLEYKQHRKVLAWTLQGSGVHVCVSGWCRAHERRGKGRRAFVSEGSLSERRGEQGTRRALLADAARRAFGRASPCGLHAKEFPETAEACSGRLQP